MIRRILLLGLALFLLVPLAVPAGAQSSGAPTITLNSQYILNSFGAVVVNETVSFSNTANSTVQIPTVQIGIPDSIASHATGFLLSSVDKYSLTQFHSGNVTTYTISPDSPTLAGSSSSTVSLKSYLSGLLGTPSSAGNLTIPVLLSPSFSQEVSLLNMEIQVPQSGSITPVPSGFGPSLAVSAMVYASAKNNVMPTIQTQSVSFGDSNPTLWHPVTVYSVVRTIIPGTNGVPQVEDQVSLRNLAASSITSLPILLVNSNVNNVTILPSSSPPVINPTKVTLTNGALNVGSPPFSSAIAAGDNFTFTMVYPLPKSDLSVSGSTVSVSIPFILPVQAIIQNYTVRLGLPVGMQADGASKMVYVNATSVLSGDAVLKYTLSPGWAADQAIPAATLIFAASFIILAFNRTKTVYEEDEEEGSETLGEKLADLIKSIEEKISMFQQFQSDLSQKSQGSVTRADFSKMKNEMDALKTRVTGRLNALRPLASSQRYLDLLNQLQEAEREEDRAAKDLLNLYDQYQSKRMREDTFKRLLPNYKKRVDSATNHLSDLLNLTQRDAKQG